MSFETLSPWDALPYWDAPVVTQFSSPVAGSRVIATYNPSRVVLYIMLAQAAGNVWIQPIVPAAATVGQLLVSNNTPLTITHNEHGLLCESAWYVFGDAAFTVCVAEIRLLRWPSPGDDIPVSPFGDAGGQAASTGGGTSIAAP